MSDLRIITTALTVTKDSLIDSKATQISLDDEGAGSFVVLTQYDPDKQELRFDMDEWTVICKAVERIIKEDNYD